MATSSSAVFPFLARLLERDGRRFPLKIIGGASQRAARGKAAA